MLVSDGATKTKWSLLKWPLFFLVIVILVTFLPEELKKDRALPRLREEKLIMAFYDKGWNNETAGLPSLKANYQNLDIISPNWYSADSYGNIVLSRGAIENEIQKVLEVSDIKLIPLLTNHKGNHQVLANENFRNQAVKNIVDLIATNGYDGINIDFELIPPQFSGELESFIKLLYAQLKPKNKFIAVSVFPKIDFPEKYHAAHNYEKIEPYTDYICIMVYDKSSPKTGPGPIAPLNWVEDNIQNALKTIPAGKLMLSIGAYGYDWSQSGNIEAVGINQAIKMAQLYQAKILWDETSQTPYFRYTKDGDKHELWFENENSAALKINLVKKYNLAGVTFWRMGYENESYFNALKALKYQPE